MKLGSILGTPSSTLVNTSLWDSQSEKKFQIGKNQASWLAAKAAWLDEQWLLVLPTVFWKKAKIQRY